VACVAWGGPGQRQSLPRGLGKPLTPLPPTPDFLYSPQGWPAAVCQQGSPHGCRHSSFKSGCRVICPQRKKGRAFTNLRNTCEAFEAIGTTNPTWWNTVVSMRSLSISWISFKTGTCSQGSPANAASEDLGTPEGLSMGDRPSPRTGSSSSPPSAATAPPSRSWTWHRPASGSAV